MTDGATGRSALLELLKIDEADLVANRRGELGARQRRNRRQRLLVIAGSCLLCGVVFLGGGKMSYSDGGQWFVPELFGVAFVLGGVYLLTRARVTRPGEVRLITGPVKLVQARIGRGGTVLLLMVGGERCRLRQPIRSPRKRWEAALSSGRYDVYVVGTVPAVVGMEIVQE